MKKNINKTKIEQFKSMREPMGLQDAIKVQQEQSGITIFSEAFALMFAR